VEEHDSRFVVGHVLVDGNNVNFLLEQRFQNGLQLEGRHRPSVVTVQDPAVGVHLEAYLLPFFSITASKWRLLLPANNLSAFGFRLSNLLHCCGDSGTIDGLPFIFPVIRLYGGTEGESYID
jgi:hypothetical protein